MSSMKEAETKDLWAIDFRRKLASDQQIDTFADRSSVRGPVLIDSNLRETSQKFLSVPFDASDDVHDADDGDGIAGFNDRIDEDFSDDEYDVEASTVMFDESKASALIGKNLSAVVNNIPVIVTDVPSFESPSNFENLLHDPKIVFRGQAGVEKAIDAKSIKKLQKGNGNTKPTSMDRARELVRTRIQTPEPQTSTARQQPLKTTTNFAGQNEVSFSTLLTTVSTTSPVLTVALGGPQHDALQEERNKLRLEIGETPIGLLETNLNSNRLTKLENLEDENDDESSDQTERPNERLFFKKGKSFGQKHVGQNNFNQNNFGPNNFNQNNFGQNNFNPNNFGQNNAGQNNFGQNNFGPNNNVPNNFGQNNNNFGQNNFNPNNNFGQNNLRPNNNFGQNNLGPNNNIGQNNLGPNNNFGQNTVRPNNPTQPSNVGIQSTTPRPITTVPIPLATSATLGGPQNDQMQAARNRLRINMGETPIGVLTTAKPRSNPRPTKMDLARLRLREEVKQKQGRML